MKKNYTVNKKKLKHHKSVWWKNLTAEEQADFIYDRMVEKHGSANWDKIYTNVISQGDYMR